VYSRETQIWSLLLATTLALGAACGCRAIVRDAATSAGAETLDGLLTAIRRHPDPELVRQVLPTILLLVDGLLVSHPDEPALLLVATNSYVMYCQAFVGDPADTERAIKLYGRAREYGLRLLKTRPFFEEALSAPMEEFDRALKSFTVEDVPELHAAASAWLGWVLAGSESMEVLADLPRALALMERVLELDDTYEHGSSHLVFALYFVLQPRGAGQDLDRSRQHFERAIELAGPQSLMPRVIYAEYYGKATLDQSLFQETLNQVLDTDLEQYPEQRLLNQLAQERATLLLDDADDFF
jgi:tetratricopeptide (TPR) repeat protein